MVNNVTDIPETSSNCGYSRERLLDLSGKILEKLEQKLTQGERFKMSQSDPTYLGYIRAFSSLMTAHNSTLKDFELAELDLRVKQLEAESSHKELVRIRE